jgi:hypothetical protein
VANRLANEVVDEVVDGALTPAARSSPSGVERGR